MSKAKEEYDNLDWLNDDPEYIFDKCINLIKELKEQNEDLIIKNLDLQCEIDYLKEIIQKMESKVKELEECK